jgi:hypothetical protein
MKSITLSILIVIAIVLLLYYFNSNMMEGFTNDEALKNIASIYNSGNMSVTDANITNSLTAKTATINGDLKVTGTTNLLGNGLFANDLRSNTGNIGIFSAGNAYAKSLNVTGATIMDGNLKVNGLFAPKGEQVIVIYNQWDQPLWIKTMASYFKKSMPDGTLLKFVFIHPNGAALRDVNANYYVAYLTGIKVGNQIICHEMVPRHQGTGDLYNNPATTDVNWRGAITNP